MPNLARIPRFAAGAAVLVVGGFIISAGAGCNFITNVDAYDFSCSTAADCPAPPSACVQVSCVAQQCATVFVAKGSALSSSPGDACAKTVCDGSGHPTSSFAALGTPCGNGGGCDGKGACKCDLSPSSCGNQDVGCIHCAFVGNCKDELEACRANAPCATLAQCIAACSGMQTCEDNCVKESPDGAGLYYSWIRCTVCLECPNACSADQEKSLCQ